HHLQIAQVTRPVTPLASEPRHMPRGAPSVALEMPVACSVLALPSPKAKTPCPAEMSVSPMVQGPIRSAGQGPFEPMSPEEPLTIVETHTPITSGHMPVKQGAMVRSALTVTHSPRRRVPDAQAIPGPT